MRGNLNMSASMSQYSPNPTYYITDICLQNNFLKDDSFNGHVRTIIFVDNSHAQHMRCWWITGDDFQREKLLCAIGKEKGLLEQMLVTP
eukprot:2399806-Amphidinium_carterae.1